MANTPCWGDGGWAAAVACTRGWCLERRRKAGKGEEKDEQDGSHCDAPPFALGLAALAKEECLGVVVRSGTVAVEEGRRRSKADGDRRRCDLAASSLCLAYGFGFR